ncbi:sodium/proline symporter [Halobiforma haloterrestris]|uniref:Sodium/proline symporter n=1 Tax=Natronobacterium haloterrestre TaxID=148448 RepID=A0A1I1JIE3_NATHA|nr:sodium/proline symporter [Halobiforma haloterrestris]SFC45713.1 sodium/proline symporter [Halobiforma haloterrestris]
MSEAQLQATFGLFVVVLLSIGLYFFFTTETKRLSDYMLADRDVGTVPIAISEVTAVASGWTFFAWVGIGFTVGMSGLWFSITMVLIVLFLYRFVAPRFRRTSEALGSQTVVDHLASTFDDHRLGPVIRLVGTVTIVVFLMSYIGAQIIAIGEAMDVGLGIPYTTAILIGGLAVAFYTTLGGFNASVTAHLLMGSLVIVAAILVPIGMVLEIGGWSAFVSEASAVDPALLTMTGGDAGTALLIAVLSWVTFAAGAIGQPHGLMRFQAIRSERIISRASVIAVAFQSLRLTVPLIMGAAGRVLYDGADVHHENVAMHAIIDIFPSWLAGLLLAGIIGAILSTSDSMMIVTSADVTRFYEEHLNPDATERELILFGRGVVLAAALIGIALAYVRPGTIFDIIEFAFVGLGASLGMPLAAVVIWEKTTAEGVFATIIVGLLGSVGNLYLFADYFPILVWPVAIATLVLVSVATYDGRGQYADERTVPTD